MNAHTDSRSNEFQNRKSVRARTNRLVTYDEVGECLQGVVTFTLPISRSYNPHSVFIIRAILESTLHTHLVPMHLPAVRADAHAAQQRLYCQVASCEADARDDGTLCRHVLEAGLRARQAPIPVCSPPRRALCARLARRGRSRGRSPQVWSP